MTSCIEEKQIEEEVIMVKRIKSIQPGIPQLEKCPIGWKPLKLGKLLKVVSRPVKLDDKMTYRLVTAKRSRGGIVSRSELLGEAIKVKTQFEIKTGDFVISRRQIVHGACGIVPEDLSGSIVSNEYLVLHSNGEVLLEYLNYLSHSIYFQQTCYHSSIGVHVEKMVFKPEVWFKYQFNIPPLTEQQKIVETLNCCDKVIKLKDDVLTEKQSLKTWLMQQLLLGEKHWSPKSVCDFGNVITGTTPPTANMEFYGGDYPWVTPTDINAEKYISSSERKLTKMGVEKGRILPEGSVLITCIASIGKNAILIKEGSCNQQINAIVPNENYSSDFIYYLIEKNIGILRKFAGTSATSIINKETFSNLVFKVPEKTEQDSIAKILSQADKEIELLKNELDEYKKLKISLMQMLLSGAVRVKI